MRHQRPKGTADLLPEEVAAWQYLERSARDIFSAYQCFESRTPIFEHYEVIARSVGDTTDIVSKEMYDFYDKGNRHITLRPEGTAPMARAYIENKLYGPEHSVPYKTFYMGPMFRYERPQAGRLRQFHQIGVEIFGVKTPSIDAETIAMAFDYFHALGLYHVSLYLNSLGSLKTRAAYRQALLDYLTPLYDQMSEDSKRRYQQNPLRVLDSKDPKDKVIVAEAPSILDYLSEEEMMYFNEVQELLTSYGISFMIDHRMVRGLDYYNDVIFEIMTESEEFAGVKTTICAGGRYDQLVEDLGGPSTPAFGFGMGMERLLLTCQAEGIQFPTLKTPDVYVVSLSDELRAMTSTWVQKLRRAGISATHDYLSRKVKGQMKAANKSGAKWTVFMDEATLEQQTVRVKDMTSGEEHTVMLDQLIDELNTLRLK